MYILEKQLEDEREKTRSAEERERVAREGETREREARERETRELRRRLDETHRRDAVRRHEAEVNIASSTIPISRVSSEDITNARRSGNLADNDYHVAICGASGTGKSTLINAIRGLEHPHEDAAGIGENETTQYRAPYKYATSTLSGGCLILHDLPGSGTPSIPHETYYNNMSLYMFDCIIVVYKDAGQFQSLLDVLKRSRIHSQTILIVRSRCDEGLSNRRRQLRSSGKSKDAVKELYFQESIQYLEGQLQSTDGLIPYITSECKPLVYHVSDETLLHVARGGTSTEDEMNERELVNRLKQLLQERSGDCGMERGMLSENTERRFVFWGAQDPRPEAAIMEMIRENRELLGISKVTV